MITGLGLAWKKLPLSRERLGMQTLTPEMPVPLEDPQLSYSDLHPQCHAEWHTREGKEGGRRADISRQQPFICRQREDQGSPLPKIGDSDPACAVPVVGDRAASSPVSCVLVPA